MYLPTRLDQAQVACQPEEVTKRPKDGALPRPSSNHLGTSIYGFADGAARQIADQVDAWVYLRLISSNGGRYGQVVSGLENY